MIERVFTSSTSTPRRCLAEQCPHSRPDPSHRGFHVRQAALPVRTDRNGRFRPDVENDAVFLPLAKGRNELVFAVAEYFGGWGLIARLDDASLVQVNK